MAGLNCIAFNLKYEVSDLTDSYFLRECLGTEYHDDTHSLITLVMEQATENIAFALLCSCRHLACLWPWQQQRAENELSQALDECDESSLCAKYAARPRASSDVS